MDEPTLTKLCVAGAATSLVAIYIFVSCLAPARVNIGEIDFSYRGQLVNVTGTIQDIELHEGSAFFTLADTTGEIDVVIWSDVLEALEAKGVPRESLAQNSTVSLVGEVDVYRGMLQVVPSTSQLPVIHQEADSR
jgi:RecJ-like exonuclease